MATYVSKYTVRTTMSWYLGNTRIYTTTGNDPFRSLGLRTDVCTVRGLQIEIDSGVSTDQ